MPSLNFSPPDKPTDASARMALGWVLAISGAALFSAKAIVAKLMYRHGVDALTVLALRMTMSCPFFVGLAVWSSRRGLSLDRRTGWRIVGLGLLGYYLSSYLDFAGLQYIPAALERLILFLMPTLVLLISAFIFKRPIARRQWVCLALSYAGIVCVFGEQWSLSGKSIGLGSALVFGAAVSYALYLIISGELIARVGATRLVAYAMCVSSVACLTHFLILRPPHALLQTAPVLWLSLLNASLCTICPVLFTMWAVSRIGAPTTSQLSMVGPLATLGLGAIFLGEAITLWQMLGTALVLAGVLTLTKRVV